jgi:hypothetical protein
MHRIVSRISVPVVTVVVLSLVAATPRVAAAQLRAGGSLGYVFDESTDFIQLGAEGRGTLTSAPIEINPRFSYQPISHGSVIQFDVNGLYDLPMPRESMFQPYAGAGVLLQRVSFSGGSDTHVGLNLVWGTELNLDSSIQPFGQFQYSVIRNETNPGVLSIGILFKFGSNGPSSAPPPAHH